MASGYLTEQERPRTILEIPAPLAVTWLGLMTHNSDQWERRKRFLLYWGRSGGDTHTRQRKFSGYGLEDVVFGKRCSDLPSSRATNLQMTQMWWREQKRMKEHDPVKLTLVSCLTTPEKITFSSIKILTYFHLFRYFLSTDYRYSTDHKR